MNKTDLIDYLERFVYDRSELVELDLNDRKMIVEALRHAH